ncbi:hypothetical protein Daesc_004921 [Daldinia eschscholtzii]|uniref:F-box domain-containing protein n=1 Tax=Daldinia eschscholtzii TaxID=292717 RepID=A0AAX6MKB5_9PEZI
MASINSLPDEIVHHILLYVSPEETLSKVALLSKRFNRVAHEPLLWRWYCKHTFKYWEASHHFKERLNGYVHGTDWRRLFLLRLGRNAYIARLLDGIVASRVSRLQKMEQICLYGYDAKDYLLSQCQAPDSAKDVLARRYYACSVLDSIHRSLAIEEWAKYQKFAARRIDEDTPNSERLNCGMRLERALGAFDMFMLHDNEGDLDEITELLDDIAYRFQSAHPYFDELTTRQKAISLSRWLRLNNMTGLNDPTEQTYRYLRNCLIGRALRDERHPSLPIISAAIYSAVASRLGLEAYPCALPSHVHATVLSRPGMTLDDRSLDEPSQHQESMFLDPYTLEDEVPLDRIIDFLSRLGIHTGHGNLLNPTSTDLIVMRTAQNIRASFTSFRTNERPLAQIIPMIELNRGDWARNLQPALYSMIWASIMMVPVLPDSDEIRWDWQQDVRDLLSAFYEHFPEDAWLVEKYVCPMYDTFAAPSRRRNNWDLPSKSVMDQIRRMRRADASAQPARRRSELAKGLEVKYRVGQVFKHRRYEYYGLILGWTVEGSSTWSDDPLSPTQRPWSTYSQPYYRCMSGTDGSDQHLIAEENIEIMDLRGRPEMLPPEIKDLMPMAGKFFKRWDSEQGVFISNQKEVYPED